MTAAALQLREQVRPNFQLLVISGNICRDERIVDLIDSREVALDCCGLLLAEVEGMALEDVARVLACPVGTVKSRIFRAKERLRGLLRDYTKE